MVVDIVMASVGVCSRITDAEADSAGHGSAHRDRPDRRLGRGRARAPRPQQVKVTSKQETPPRVAVYGGWVGSMR
jgi:hypothetical protein